MGRVRAAIARAAIRVAFRRPSPDRITLSAPKALKNNFFHAQLGDRSKRAEPLFLARKLSAEGLEGVWFNEERPLGEPGDPSCIPWSQVESFEELEITHYYKGFVIAKSSALQFLLYYFSCWYVVIYMKDALTQALFNRRSLARRDRLKVLRLLVDQSLDKPDYQTSQFEVTKLLNGVRYLRHPEGNRTTNHHRFVLDSLVESGELKRIEHGYQITPKALATLSSYEEDERRHRSQIRTQIVLAFLTAALVVIGIAQVIATAAEPESQSLP